MIKAVDELYQLAETDTESSAPKSARSRTRCAAAAEAGKVIPFFARAPCRGIKSLSSHAPYICIPFLVTSRTLVKRFAWRYNNEKSTQELATDIPIPDSRPSIDGIEYDWRNKNLKLRSHEHKAAVISPSLNWTKRRRDAQSGKLTVLTKRKEHVTGMRAISTARGGRGTPSLKLYNLPNNYKSRALARAHLPPRPSRPFPLPAPASFMKSSNSPSPLPRLRHGNPSEGRSRRTDVGGPHVGRAAER
ncbi:hypothetical protein EVAR_47016_1 [Eumeta japonica]|uniref:Uncharacterized protein n=1 Tax=Eumeta variegata TaxID=151549 RepID=A0A4C1XJU6_EUMVA|nr:hypothetical protein EVAR_47016_1 [Eumeta japonica]